MFCCISTQKVNVSSQWSLRNLEFKVICKSPRIINVLVQLQVYGYLNLR